MSMTDKPKGPPCPLCGAPCVQNDVYATGDWNMAYACGTSNDDNDNRYVGQRCKNRQREAKERQ